MTTQPLEQHDQAYRYCSLCPKACSSACPVSAVTKTETHSAWGKMNVAHRLHTSGAQADIEESTALHACTGCGKCTDVCGHRNDVTSALFSARGVTQGETVQPPGASSTVATFEQSENPFGRDLHALAAQFRHNTAARFQFFPGCSALVKASKAIEDTLVVSNAFGATLIMSTLAGRCCGYPLYAAGAHDAFHAHARQFAKALEAHPEMIVLDPGCAHTITKVYPRFDIVITSRVRTVTSLLADYAVHAPKKPPLKERAAYHDACHLGRGLGEYDAPRVLLSRAVESLDEAFMHGPTAGCSGGGGLLPRTMPTVAVEIARREAKAFPEEPQIVSGCPTARRMFQRAGKNAVDVVSLLRRWLEAESQ